MRIVARFLVFALLGCSPDATGPMRDDGWESYPWSVAHFEGPTPIISAFLVPVGIFPGLRPVVTFTNPGPDSLRIFHGACSFGLRLYSSPSLLGSPVWHNYVDACDAIGYWLDVPPGESRSKPISAYVDPAQMTNVLAAGRYYAALTWRASLKSRVRFILAGEVYIP